MPADFVPHQQRDHAAPGRPYLMTCHLRQGFERCVTGSVGIRKLRTLIVYQRCTVGYVEEKVRHAALRGY